jgi:hypothetical protein
MAVRSERKSVYGTEVSPDLISRVTDAVIDEVREWQNRPLDPVYPVVFFDALRVKAGGPMSLPPQGKIFANRSAECSSRPLLLQAIGRQTSHAGRTTVTITSSHGEHARARAALTRIAGFFEHLRKTAEQLTALDRWYRIATHSASWGPITAISPLYQLQLELVAAGRRRHDSGAVAARYRHAIGGLSVRFLAGQSVRNPADSKEFSAHGRPALADSKLFAAHRFVSCWIRGTISC